MNNVIQMHAPIDPGTTPLQNRVLMTLWSFRPWPLSLTDIYMADGCQGPMTPYAVALTDLEALHFVESEFFAGDYKSRLTKWGRLHLLGLTLIGAITIEDMVLATLPEEGAPCQN